MILQVQEIGGSHLENHFCPKLVGFYFFSGEVWQQVFYHTLPHKKEDLGIGYRLLGGSSQDGRKWLRTMHGRCCPLRIGYDPCFFMACRNHFPPSWYDPPEVQSPVISIWEGSETQWYGSYIPIIYCARIPYFIFYKRVRWPTEEFMWVPGWKCSRRWGPGFVCLFFDVLVWKRFPFW